MLVFHQHVYVCVYTDVDECHLQLHSCNENAICVNIPGGYECRCRVGYTGTGFHCSGKTPPTVTQNSYFTLLLNTFTVGLGLSYLFHKPQSGIMGKFVVIPIVN